MPVTNGIETGTVPVPTSEAVDSVAWTGLPNVLFGKSPVSVAGRFGPPVPVTKTPPVPVAPNEDVGVGIDSVMFEEAVDDGMGAESPVPVGLSSSEQDVVLARGYGGEDVEALVGILVPIEPVPVGPREEVLLSIGNGGGDVSKAGGILLPIDPVPVGPTIEVVFSIGNGGEGEDGIAVTPVPINPVPVGPAVGPKGDVSLVMGYGGVGNEVSGIPMTKGAVPVGPAVAPDGEVILIIGYGADGDEISVGTEGITPVPIGAVTSGAVPGGPEVGEVVLSIGKGGEEEDMLKVTPIPVPMKVVAVGPFVGPEMVVLLSMGKGGEGVDSLKVTPGPVPVPHDVMAVGPSVGPGVMVLLSIGNGGEGEGTAEDDPVPIGAVPVVRVPVGGMTVHVESVKEWEEEDPVPIGAVPVGPTVGPTVVVLLSIGNGAEGDDTTREDPVPTDAVTIGAVPVGPSVGPEVAVLLSIGNGGEGDDTREDDPVPIGAVTLGDDEVGESPGRVRVGRDVEKEALGDSAGMLMDDDTSPEDEALGTDAVSVGVQSTAVCSTNPSTAMDVTICSRLRRISHFTSVNITYLYSLIDVIGED